MVGDGPPKGLGYYVVWMVSGCDVPLFMPTLRVQDTLD